MTYESTRRKYLISTDQRKLKLNLVCSEIKKQYWAKDLSFACIKKSIKNSRAYGLYYEGEQIGFAKVLSDQSRFAYLSDVFILEEYRGKGLAIFLIKSVLNDPKLKHVAKWMLATKDAHNLYKKVGFEKLKNPNAFMQLIIK
jgi:GNAT superfamily N-acetyltransferase